MSPLIISRFKGPEAPRTLSGWNIAAPRRRGPMATDDLLRTFSPSTLGSERGGTEVREILLEGNRLGIFDEQQGEWNLAGAGR